MLSALSLTLRPLVSFFADWRARERAYTELQALDDRSLADIGLTRGEIPFLLHRSKKDPDAVPQHPELTVDAKAQRVA
ncbi:MAG TPA: DUF1127 domain-containing protein [Stellaceae bacterium]|nr:DUF1127 domain-containing protein [Stellaceae bacterium]